MNLVGKIFTVLIFLMCVVFGTFALMVHAAHKNWKVEVVKLSEDLTKANAELVKEKDEKKNLETALNDEKERMKRRLIALENERKIAVDERDVQEKKLLDEEGQVNRLALALKQANQNIGVLQAANDGMQKDIKVAGDERIALQKRLVDVNDQLMNTVAERQRLEKLQRELVAQITKMRETLGYLGVNGEVTAKSPPGHTPGEVTAVPDPNTVEISLGADDGVRVGHKFTVTRPSVGKYIGVIQVVRVDWPNRAVCRPDRALQNDQIQKGDRVDAYTKGR